MDTVRYPAQVMVITMPHNPYRETDMKNIVIYFAVAAFLPTMSACANDGITENTPQEIANNHQCDLLNQAGEDELRSKNYSEAEKSFRAVQSIDHWDSQAQRGVAESLAGEGRLTEAIQFYKILTTQNPFKWSSVAQEARTGMEYAILLSQAGRWSEAVNVYEDAAAKTNSGTAPKFTTQFTAKVPLPLQLQAVAHIAIGIEYSINGDSLAASQEFQKGAQLSPKSALTNYYYYGYGWQRLNPEERAKIGSREQVIAELRKNLKSSDPVIRKASATALDSVIDGQPNP